MHNAQHAEAGAVVCVGESGLNAVAIIRSLGRRGIPVHAVSLAGSAQIASSSRYCSGRTEVEDLAGLYGALRRIARGRAQRPVLFVDNDAMLRHLAPSADRLQRLYCLVDPIGDALRYTDKEFQLEAARAAGIPVPRSWFPREREDIHALRGETRARLLAKPLPGPAGGAGAAFKAIVAVDSSELLALLDQFQADASSVVVQEYIEGGDASLYSGYCYRAADGRKPLLFSSRKLRQHPPGAGVMAVGEPYDAPEVREMTARLADALEYRGVMSTEFKRDRASGNYYFIEWNPRLDACHSLGWRSGADCAWVAYRDHAHPGIPLEAAARYDSGHVWINVECDLKSLARAPRRIFSWSTWRPYLRDKEWAVFALDDPKPWAKAAARTLSWVYGGLLRALGRMAPKDYRQPAR
jgi:predicted ATP-grasp superfamily ATP-dependent carboligase